MGATPTDLLCRFDVDGAILDANEPLCDFFGRRPEQLRGSRYFDLFPVTEHRMIDEAIATLQLGQPPRPREAFLTNGRGARRLIQWIDYPQSSPGGELECIQSVGRDITDLRGEEWRELCERSERLQLAIHGSNDGLWDWNITTGEVFYSPRFLDILKLERRHCLPEIESILSRVHPDDVPQLTDALDHHLHDRRPFLSEFRLLNGSGEYAWVVARGQAVWAADGTATRMAGSIADVSLRRRTEEKLEASKERFRLLFQHSPIGLALSTIGGDIVEANPTFQAMTGRDDFEDCTMWTLTPSKYHDEQHEKQASLEETGSFGPFEKEYVRPDDTRLPVIEHGVRVEDAEGREFVWSIVEDDTERRRVERAKGEFLANMSHEVRTPLTAIHGFLDLLSATTREEERTAYIETIRNNASHLLSIVNDMLDLSRLESDALDLELSPCAPGDVLNEMVERFGPRARGKNIGLELYYRSKIPAHISSDPVRFRQILINLIGNAVKFTETGRVRIEVDLDDSSPSPSLQVDVLDSGIGISESAAAVLFQPFSKGDTSMSRRFGGTGLGLAICRRLAEKLSGEVYLVESTVGQGSRFRLRVATGPLDDVPLLDRPSLIEQEARPKRDPLRLSARILLVEDGPDNQRLIGHLLRKSGAQVDLAENGRVAIEKVFLADREDNQYDLILMDMQMPELDGYDATAILRQAGFGLPIIAVTAHAMVGDREKCMQAGCDEYLTKPVKREKLVATCIDFLGHESTYA